jgi:hypothetical protein
MTPCTSLVEDLRERFRDHFGVFVFGSAMISPKNILLLISQPPDHHCAKHHLLALFTILRRLAIIPSHPLTHFDPSRLLETRSWTDPAWSCHGSGK